MLTKNVFLRDNLSIGLMKCLLPDKKNINSSINKNFNDVITRLNRSRSTKKALLYYLISENLYIDCTELDVWDSIRDKGSNHIRTGDPIYNYRLFQHWANVEEMGIKFSDSILDHYSQQLFPSQSDLKNNIFSLNEITEKFFFLEPLIWKRCKAFSPENRKFKLTRENLHDILFYFHTRPKLIKTISDETLRAGAGEPIRNIKYTLDFLYPLSEKYKINSGNLNRFLFTIGSVLCNAEIEYAFFQNAERLKSLIVVEKLQPFNKIAIKNDHNNLLLEENSVTTNFKLLLREFKYLPAFQTIEDVIKIKKDKSYKDFQYFLFKYISALKDGDESEISKLKIELEKTNLSLKRAFVCDKIEGFFTYISLPSLIVDLLLTQGLIGAGITISSFGLKATSDRIKRKSQWVSIGKD